ncbi:hypothetical protein RND81_14G111900 [Saponaria officinalis]|uniref:Nudix hydrolase domain-containing protein n=1 Tax=Saponaria officinalis TaxID=3572 RepID=A0AAW1GNV6_SAPOF
MLSSILRKVPLNLLHKPTFIKPPPLISPSILSIISMESSSKRLAALAQQLRFYKPPPEINGDDNNEDIEKETGKVVAQVGFAESSNPISQNLDDQINNNGFEPKRAAVLVCLFEGDHGDLRVILTKRSSKLSTHSGEVALPGGKAEEGDKDDADTATREAQEEIGLEPSLVNVVTTLEPFLSKVYYLYVLVIRNSRFSLLVI